MRKKKRDTVSKPREIKRSWIINACVLVLCAGSLSVFPAQQAQKIKQLQDEDESRDVCYYCENERPPRRVASSSSRAGKPVSKKVRRYVRKTPRLPTSKQRPPLKQPALKNPGYEELGITIWRYRRSTAADDKEIRILDDDEEAELTPVRITADTALSVGDRIQLSIESPRSGYLYIIDREQYANGEVSPPYLIFPNSRTPERGNQTRAGKLIYIPAMERRKPYFTLRELNPESKVKITGEILTVIVSPAPLSLPHLGSSRTLLPDDKVKQWEGAWTVPLERLEMEGGVGQAQTRAEKAVGADETRILDQDDPAPQTIYRGNVKRGNPLLVTIPLRYD